MPDYPKRPKMEFKSNIPETVTLQKQPPKFKGENEGKAWWGWEIQHNGEDKTMFANEQLQTELQDFPAGTTVVINWSEETNAATGKKYHIYKVNQAVFDKDGRAPKPAPPPIAEKNGLPTEDYRKNRKNAYFLALEDAYEVANTFRDTHSVTEPKFEDVRAIAVSMVIQFDRKA